MRICKIWKRYRKSKFTLLTNVRNVRSKCWIPLELHLAVHCKDKMCITLGFSKAWGGFTSRFKIGLKMIILYLIDIFRKLLCIAV